MHSQWKPKLSQRILAIIITVAVMATYNIANWQNYFSNKSPFSRWLKKINISSYDVLLLDRDLTELNRKLADLEIELRGNVSGDSIDLSFRPLTPVSAEDKIKLQKYYGRALRLLELLKESKIFKNHPTENSPNSLLLTVRGGGERFSVPLATHELELDPPGKLFVKLLEIYATEDIVDENQG
ncbi:MAG: hypothetical protein KDD53_01495 [Bdellovibrionales bacterium]|nr:hypothetical protein [Bdellovibrionales bacterium]